MSGVMIPVGLRLDYFHSLLATADRIGEGEELRHFLSDLPLRRAGNCQITVFHSDFILGSFCLLSVIVDQIRVVRLV